MGRKRHASEYLADSDSVSSASTSKIPGRSVKQEGVARMKSMGGLVLLGPIQSIAFSLGYEQLDLSWIVTGDRYRCLPNKTIFLVVFHFSSFFSLFFFLFFSFFLRKHVDHGDFRSLPVIDITVYRIKRYLKFFFFFYETYCSWANFDIRRRRHNVTDNNYKVVSR